MSLDGKADSELLDSVFAAEMMHASLCAHRQQLLGAPLYLPGHALLPAVPLHACVFVPQAVKVQLQEVNTRELPMRSYEAGVPCGIANNIWCTKMLMAKHVLRPNQAKIAPLAMMPAMRARSAVAMASGERRPASKSSRARWPFTLEEMQI